MKKALFIIIVFLLAVPLLAGMYKSYAGKGTISDKNKTIYYSFDKRHPLTVSLHGPANYTFYIRALTTDDSKTFPMEITIEGNLFAKVDVKNVKSKYRFNGNSCTKAEVVTISVPSGRFEGKVSPRGRFIGIARVKREKKKEDYIEFVPQGFKEEKLLVVNEKQYSYYLADSENPVELELIGPLKLKVYTRVIYGEGMRGKLNYNYLYRIDGDEKKLSVTTRPSESASLTGAEIISVAEMHTIKVPEGEHSIQFYPNSKHKEVLFRFYIPENRLKIAR